MKGRIHTIGNIKAGRVRIYKLSTFKAFTQEENETHRDKKRKALELDEKISEFRGQRVIDAKYLYNKSGENERYQVAIFESDIVRLALKDNGYDKADMQLLDEIIYMKVYHYTIMWQIIEDGIIIANTEYMLYSATTGQQRNVTITLIRKDFYERHESELLVGLSVPKINSMGGMNAGKYLAYTALALSSSVLPDKLIDIDRCIVVADFESIVIDYVKFIDIQSDKNGELFVADTPKEYIEKSIPITHTDGAGMFLPGELPSSCQIRSGFFKGAIFPFDFRRFAVEVVNNTVITDAWGDTVDIVRDDIRFIFTTSQLKMWKFYSSWNEYKQKFKENGIQLSINSYANPAKDEVALSYQYLQTLPHGCDIEKLCKKTKDQIIKLHTDIDIVKKLMGYKLDDEETIDIEDKVQSPLCGANIAMAEALAIYPQLIHDPYIIEKIQRMVRSCRRKAKAGKIIVDGYYSYAAPDLYAFCQYLFTGDKDPQGLIPQNHVYNQWLADKGNVDYVTCLRSPHLSAYEYGKRTLVKDNKCTDWFQYMESDTIVSCHDLLTKTLQMDFDGDEILITSDEELYRLAEDTPPLYYEMSSAGSKQLDSVIIYDTLVKAFKNNVIGDVSNIIAKLWNSPDITSEQPNKYDDAINVFCAYSNFSIDFPKTGKNICLGRYQELYNRLAPSAEAFRKPEVLYPNFFVEAKGKKKSQCNELTDSVMDRIKAYIEQGTCRIRYRYNCLGNFDYTMLMCHALKDDDKPKYAVNRYNNQYDKLRMLLSNLKRDKKKLGHEIDEEIKRRCVDTSEIYERYNIFHYHCVRKIKELFLTKEGYFNYRLAVNYLVDLEYCQHEFTGTTKDIMWKCFGHIIVDNLKINTNSQLTIKSRPRMTYIKALNGGSAIVNDIIDKKIRCRSVDILDTDYDWMTKNLPVKKSGLPYQNDLKILFVLICMYKDAKKSGKLYDEYIRIRKKQYVKMDGKKIKTFYSFPRILELSKTTSYRDSIGRFQKNELITVKMGQEDKYLDVKINLPGNQNGNILFTVNDVQRPIVYLDAYEEHKKICQCKVCGLDFVKGSNNQKTCSNKCQERLKKLNQAKVNDKNGIENSVF